VAYLLASAAYTGSMADKKGSTAADRKKFLLEDGVGICSIFL